MPVTPARRDVVARRNVPFGLTWTFTNADGSPFSLAGHSGRLQVRLYEGAPGSALIDLGNVTSDTEGVRVFAATGEVQVIIGEASLAALPDAAEAGDALALKYDLVLTGPGASQEVWVYGNFTIQYGVTD